MNVLHTRVQRAVAAEMRRRHPTTAVFLRTGWRDHFQAEGLTGTRLWNRITYQVFADLREMYPEEAALVRKELLQKIARDMGVPRYGKDR